MSIGQNYPGDLPRRITETVTIVPNVFYSTYGLDRLTDHAILPSGNGKVTAGTPLVFKPGSTTNVYELKFGVINTTASTSLTMRAGQETRFAATDVVWCCNANGTYKERLGAVVSVNTTTHVIVVTLAPVNADPDYLYVADADHATATSSAAAAYTLTCAGADNAAIATWWSSITVTATHEKTFEVGDYVYETATNGTGIKNLGRVAYIDDVNHIIYVTIAPGVTGGGFLYAGGKIPKIIGIATWSQEALTDALVATNAVIFYTTDCIVLRSMIGSYTDTTYDGYVVNKIMTDLPRVTVTTKEVRRV